MNKNSKNTLAAATNYTLIPVNSCVIDSTGEFNKRINRNDALFEQLANDMKKNHTLYEPITVYKRDDEYVIVDGRHRYEAYKVANLGDTIAAFVITDEQTARDRALLANIQRSEMDCIDLALTLRSIRVRINEERKAKNEKEISDRDFAAYVNYSKGYVTELNIIATELKEDTVKAVRNIPRYSIGKLYKFCQKNKGLNEEDQCKAFREYSKVKDKKKSSDRERLDASVKSLITMLKSKKSAFSKAKYKEENIKSENQNVIDAIELILGQLENNKVKVRKKAQVVALNTVETVPSTASEGTKIGQAAQVAVTE